MTATIPLTSRSQPKRPRDVSRTEDPDVGLMLQVREDDATAFAELVERYWRQIFAHVYRQLGDRSEAEDLAQEVFLRLFRYRKRYQPRARFTTWLFHIAQNVVRNALRSRRRRPTVHLPSLAGQDGEDQATLHFLRPAADSPSRPLERAEIADVVRRAVATLAGRQRAALELHQFADLSYAEIAAEMDMTPKAAKSLLYRARTQLRDTLRSFMAEAGEDEAVHSNS